MTAPPSPALDELVRRWRLLDAKERAAFLVMAWQERWPIPTPRTHAAPLEDAEAP